MQESLEIVQILDYVTQFQEDDRLSSPDVVSEPEDSPITLLVGWAAIDDTVLHWSEPHRRALIFCELPCLHCDAADDHEE